MNLFICWMNQGEAAQFIRAWLNGRHAAPPAHPNSTPHALLHAPRPPDFQAQPPLPTVHWPFMGQGGARLPQAGFPGSKGAADRADNAGSSRSDGTAVQPRAQQQCGSGSSGDEGARYCGARAPKTEAERAKNRCASWAAACMHLSQHATEGASGRVHPQRISLQGQEARPWLCAGRRQASHTSWDLYC